MYIRPPPTAGGGMFANCSALRHVCQLCQRMAKYALPIDKLYQNYITRGYVCKFGGPHNVGKHTFLVFFFFKNHT